MVCISRWLTSLVDQVRQLQCLDFDSPTYTEAITKVRSRFKQVMEWRCGWNWEEIECVCNDSSFLNSVRFASILNKRTSIKKKFHVCLQAVMKYAKTCYMSPREQRGYIFAELKVASMYSGIVRFRRVQ